MTVGSDSSVDGDVVVGGAVVVVGGAVVVVGGAVVVVTKEGVTVTSGANVEVVAASGEQAATNRIPIVARTLIGFPG